jgi:putative ABC transport system substrate-binding protein
LLGCGPPPSDTNDVVAGLIRGLTQRGYMLDRNVMFERRGAQFHFDRLPGLVDELVANRVDVIVALCYPAAAAAEQGTKTIPIVSAGTHRSGQQPVAAGRQSHRHVGSGGRTRCKTLAASQRDGAPAPPRGDALQRDRPWHDAAIPGVGGGLPLGVREPEGFDAAFAAMTRDPPDGLFMVTDALTSLNRRRVFDFATAHRMPAMYEYEPIVRDGGLMSYGPDMGELQGHVASLIERILKGAKPAELPFEQPTLFRFVINLKTAKALHLEVPPSLLARADEVIE